MNNTRQNVIIKYKGISKNIQQWAEYLGLKHTTLYYRFRRGWPKEQALVSNLFITNKHVRHN